MTMARLYLAALVVLALMVGPACGGGGSAEIGVLVDGPVSGVSYETDTQAGVTNADGEFRYLPGETVTFFLGDTVLGQTVGKDEVTPFDLAGADVPDGGAELVRAVHVQTSAFQRVINLAVLFQSLDADQDPENGIEITEEVAALFDGVDLPLDWRWLRFVNEGLFRPLMQEVRGVLGSRPVVKPAYAMKHLYEALDLQATLFVPTKRNLFNSADEPFYSFEQEYDDNANLMLSDEDEDLDRTPDYSETHLYDDNGNETRLEIDLDNNGAPDRVFATTYDENGHRMQYAKDQNGDGTSDWIDTYTYGEHGYTIRLDQDTDNDGTTDYIAVIHYNENGVQIGEDHDEDANGIPEIMATYEYDAHGNRTLGEIDNDGDGTADSKIVTEYDADGNSTYYAFHSDIDGPPDYSDTYEYDANGNRTRATNFGADGMPDRIRAFTYNEDGYLTRLDHDDDGDETIDRYEVRTLEATDGWAQLLRYRPEW